MGTAAVYPDVGARSSRLMSVEVAELRLFGLRLNRLCMLTVHENSPVKQFHVPAPCFTQVLHHLLLAGLPVHLCEYSRECRVGALAAELGGKLTRNCTCAPQNDARKIGGRTFHTASAEAV